MFDHFTFFFSTQTREYEHIIAFRVECILLPSEENVDNFERLVLTWEVSCFFIYFKILFIKLCIYISICAWHTSKTPLHVFLAQLSYLPFIYISYKRFYYNIYVYFCIFKFTENIKSIAFTLQLDDSMRNYFSSSNLWGKV